MGRNKKYDTKGKKRRKIGLRINMTMDSMTVKRHVCKKCHTLLLPNGSTPCRVRVSARGGTHVIVTCGHCGYVRRYPARDWQQPCEQAGKVEQDGEGDGQQKQVFHKSENKKHDTKTSAPVTGDVTSHNNASANDITTQNTAPIEETKSLTNDSVNIESHNKVGQHQTQGGIMDRCRFQ